MPYPLFQTWKGYNSTIQNYVLNYLKASIKLKNDVIFWPNKEERTQMKNRLTVLGFSHCVGIITGTLIVLDRKAGRHFECYYSYCTIVCDDNCRVIYYLVGWLGSVHDKRGQHNSDLFQN